MVLWSIFEFSQSRIPHMSLLKALRSIATFSATVGSCGRRLILCPAAEDYPMPCPSTQIGFIPMFEILLSVLSCGNTKGFAPDVFWASLGYQCFAGGHLAFVVVSLFFAALFLTIVSVYAFIFIDSNPLSPGYDGCTSGHAAVFMLLWKVRFAGRGSSSRSLILMYVLWGFSTSILRASLSSHVRPRCLVPPAGRHDLAGAVHGGPSGRGGPQCHRPHRWCRPHLYHVHVRRGTGLAALPSCASFPLTSFRFPYPAGVHCSFMPATTHFMNELQLAFGFAFFSTAVAAALSQGYPGFDGAVRKRRSAHTASSRLVFCNYLFLRMPPSPPQILAYAGMLPAAAFGVYLADVRRLRLLQCVPSHLSSPHEIDLWARYVLSDALERVLREFADGDGGAATAVEGAAAPRLSSGGDLALPQGHPSPSPGSAGVGCPVMRHPGDAGSVPAVADSKPRDLSPQVYAAMDVDERTDSAWRGACGCVAWCGSLFSLYIFLSLMHPSRPQVHAGGPPPARRVRAAECRGPLPALRHAAALRRALLPGGLSYYVRIAAAHCLASPAAPRLCTADVRGAAAARHGPPHACPAPRGAARRRVRRLRGAAYGRLAGGHRREQYHHAARLRQGTYGRALCDARLHAGAGAALWRAVQARAAQRVRARMLAALQRLCCSRGALLPHPVHDQPAGGVFAHEGLDGCDANPCHCSIACRASSPCACTPSSTKWCVLAHSDAWRRKKRTPLP